MSSEDYLAAAAGASSPPPPTHYGSSSSINTSSIHQTLISHNNNTSSSFSSPSLRNNNITTTTTTPEQQNQLALHLVKRELLRIQTHIDKISSSNNSNSKKKNHTYSNNTTSGNILKSLASHHMDNEEQQFNDVKSLENYLLSLGANSSSSLNNNNNNNRQKTSSSSLLSELLLLLWKKFDQLQTLRGVPAKKKWIPSLSVATTVSSSSSASPSFQNTNNNITNNNMTNLLGPFETFLFEERKYLERRMIKQQNRKQKASKSISSSSDDSEDDEEDSSDADDEGNSNFVLGKKTTSKRNLENRNNTSTAADSNNNSKHALDELISSLAQTQREEANKISQLLQGRSLIRSSTSLKPETIRAIVNCCQLDAESENLLRQASGALQRQKLQDVFSVLQQQQQQQLLLSKKKSPHTSSSNNNNNSNHLLTTTTTSSIATPTASDILESVAVEIDLDSLLRRVCSMVDTFASELAVEKKKASSTTTTTTPPRATPTAGASTPTPQRSSKLTAMTRKNSASISSPNNNNFGSPSSSSSNTNNQIHRMLLPPMSVGSLLGSQQQQQQQDTLENTFNSQNLGSSTNALLIDQHQQQLLLSPTNKRVNDIVERERRQHAIETSQMENEIEILSRKIDHLQKELDSTHEFYKQQQKEKEVEQEKKRPTQQNELVLAKQQLTELNDTCSGLQRVRKEETKRSLQIIADLEKQVAKQQDTLALRELELDRLEGAISSFITLHLTETQRAIFEHEARTEFAQKCLLLREKTYPHGLVVENHQLREKLFDVQCQSDEREKSLALTQQKLRDAKEQLQVSDAEASNFISKLKTSKEWRTLTLAAGEETAAAVKVISALFEERKQNLKQQEDAQATRYRMLELRLGEEVVARRQKNIQSVPASDEAEKMLQSYQDQVRGMEDIIMRKQLQKKMESYYSGLGVNNNNNNNNTNANNSEQFEAMMTRVKEDLTGKVISRALEKGKSIPIQDLKVVLGV